MGIEFQDSRLVKQFGSWVRVQVAFYDFLFETGTGLCARHFREQLNSEVQAGRWADGEGLYEDTVSALEKTFSSPGEAWKAFIESADVDA